MADQVVATGEPLVIERRGVRLRLVREDAVDQHAGRLARLKPRKQSVVVGLPLDPHESPAQWAPAWPQVAEPTPPHDHGKARSGKSRKRP